MHLFSELNLPRHTSFPILPAWNKNWDHFTYEPELINKLNSETYISLYIHVPFCRKLCHYCACNKEIIPDGRRSRNDPSIAYLISLGRELKIISDLVGRKMVKQLHLGGGSPTFLKNEHLTLLMEQISTWFGIEDVEEMSVEVDPRITSKEQLIHLKNLGFNRISLGVQDFDPNVQKAIGREQSFSLVREFVEWVRALNFDSLNFDLIYGLPKQTIKTVDQTVGRVLELSPDRIAFYRLAMFPEIFKWHRSFNADDLPTSDCNITFFEIAASKFKKDYEMIGFDHFSKKNESLSMAKENGSIRRNFQGMTTYRNYPVLGFGPSAISDLDGVYSQNAKTVEEWSRLLKRGFLPAKTGMVLSKKDQLFKEIMNDLYGLGKVDLNSLVEKASVQNIEINRNALMEKITKLASLKLITFDKGIVELTYPLGQMLARVCGAAFDFYLPDDAYLNGVSRYKVSKV